MARFLKSQEGGVLVALVGLCLFFTLLNPNFLSTPNITAVLRSAAYPGIMGIGLALCLMSGTIDLSIGSTSGLAAVIMAHAAVVWGLSPWTCVALGILSGLCVGLLNAYMVLKLKVSSFIATIGSMFAVRGIVSWVSGGYIIYPIQPILSNIGSARVGVSWAFWFMIASMLVIGYLLSTVWGLSVRATGSDRETAFNTEVKVDRINLSTFLLSGFFAAASGVFIAMKIGGALPTIGQGTELSVIAACVVGGISLSGYTGSIMSLLLGLLVTQVIANGIVVIGINPYLQNTALGILMTLAVWLDTARRRRLGLNL